MDDEQIAVARELAAHPNFRWMPGVLPGGDEYARIAYASACGRHIERWEEDPIEQGNPWYPSSWTPNAIPDLTDPATIGCLAALATEANDYVAMWLEYDLGVEERWQAWAVDVEDNIYALPIRGPTEGIAWARAIMAAPKREG